MGHAASVRPVVEVEQEVYRYQPAGNGAGPMWCHGSTCIVRAGGRVFASGIETLPDVKPLCNCQPMLLMQTSAGWKQIYRDSGRTREPCPMATFADGSVFMSINRTLSPPEAYNGPARPATRINTDNAADRRRITPTSAMGYEVPRPAGLGSLRQPVRASWVSGASCRCPATCSSTHPRSCSGRPTRPGAS